MRRRAVQSLKNLMLVVLGSAVVAAAGGCGDDNPTAPPVEQYPVSNAPDQLVENLVKAYGERNFVEYEKALADDFQFWFAAEDVGSLGQVMFWGRNEDVESTQNMFSGAVGQKPDGTPVPGVQSITLSLIQAEDWVDAGGELVGGITEVPVGARRARYAVDMTVSYTFGDIVSQVRGQQLFYAVPVTEGLGDAATTEWKLFLWRDLGNSVAKAVETVSWGSIKARF